MSVCGQTEEESASEEAGPAREAYEQKAVSKVVRVLTVLAYLLSVSLAAILLSVYYVCVWKSPVLPPLNGTGGGEVAARRAGPAEHPYNGTLHVADNGGGGISVNDTFGHPAAAAAAPDVTNGSATGGAPQTTELTARDTRSYSTLADLTSPASTTLASHDTS